MLCFRTKMKEIKQSHRRRHLFYIPERGRVAACLCPLCGLRETTATTTVKNSNLIGKKVVRGILFQGKKEELKQTHRHRFLFYIRERGRWRGVRIPFVD